MPIPRILSQARRRCSFQDSLRIVRSFPTKTKRKTVDFIAGDEPHRDRDLISKHSPAVPPENQIAFLPCASEPTGAVRLGSHAFPSPHAEFETRPQPEKYRDPVPTPTSSPGPRETPHQDFPHAASPRL